MNKEKILAFLNMDSKKNIDKFSLKLFTWFHVGFSVFVFGGGASLQLIRFSWFNCIAWLVGVLSVVFLFLTITFCKKNTDEWFHHLCAIFFSILVLLYGWFIFSKDEHIEFGYPIFEWMHIAVLLSAFSLGGYIMLKFYRTYKIIMNHTIEEAQMILLSQSRNNNAMLIPASLTVSPVMLVRIFRGPFADMEIGIGFCLWGLMCIWFVLALMMLPKIIVILKYKVYLWFDK